ncbi:MAG TPA: hypothetical protein EYP09_09020 [Anaerolineae bacterium]|nr:hypothetical protein [Anaerolineae bacterium]
MQPNRPSFWKRELRSMLSLAPLAILSVLLVALVVASANSDTRTTFESPTPPPGQVYRADLPIALKNVTDMFGRWYLYLPIALRNFIFVSPLGAP